jgi:hypothetical protein
MLLMLGLTGCYLALSPCTTEGRGYVPEDITAGLGMLSSFNAWIKGRPVPPLTWTRHGPVPLLFDLPFIKLGKMFISPDFVVSFQHVLLTAALLTLVYVWLRKLCTPGISLSLTLIGAFGTMLWPYAYIGLETKQSFFVLLAGYLALARGKIQSWLGLFFFGVVCAFAVCSKSTGAVLVPPIAYLIYVQFRDDWRQRWKQALMVSGIVAGTWALGAIGWNFFWAPKGGGAQLLLDQWTTHSPLQMFGNFVGLLGSPNKGLFVFAPVLVLSLFAIPRAFRTHRELTVFGLLVALTTLAFISTLIIIADELWGPRFMHITIAPMLLIIGAAYSRFRWQTVSALILLGTLGTAISFLGAFYYYGARGWAATATGQNTLEWFAGDPKWNEIEFDALLFGSWLKSGNDPVPWTPIHHWAWTAPPDAPPPKTVNLREYDDPQSFLLYYWTIPLEGSNLLMFRICLASLVVGPLLLLWVVADTVRNRGTQETLELPEAALTRDS